jgi:hypothetical protein
MGVFVRREPAFHDLPANLLGVAARQQRPPDYAWSRRSGVKRLAVIQGFEASINNWYCFLQEKRRNRAFASVASVLSCSNNPSRLCLNFP